VNTLVLSVPVPPCDVASTRAIITEPCKEEFHNFFRYLVLVVTKVKAEGFVDAESMPAAEGTRPMVEFEELNAMVDGLPEGSDGRARCMAGPV
jgi:hypothetical protein